MRSTLGSITATLSVRIGDGDPADVATLEIPVTVNAPFGGVGDIVVDSQQVNENLARALHEAAAMLDPSTTPGIDRHHMASQHRAVRHEDGKEPWCDNCGLTRSGPRSRPA